jgi:hypothetical protein
LLAQLASKQGSYYHELLERREGNIDTAAGDRQLDRPAVAS